ncbi:MAG: putative DNA binding domain-containing protein [Acidobacteriota bacterium]|nr:putative DNA binding domain-containing protein [Acidobacteriota bacterium]
MNLDEVNAWAAEGESDIQEFKATTSEQYEALKSLCGMLNGRGGRVLFGVTPEGRVVGQQVGEQTIHKLAQDINQRFDPAVSPVIALVRVDDVRSVIVVEVERGRLSPYSFDGVAYAKVGNTKTKMSQGEKDRLMAERLHQSDSWDAAPSPLGVETLDLDELESTVREAIGAGRMSDPPDWKPVTLLRCLGLVVRDGRLRNGALVLFGRPDALMADYPSCSISLVRYNGLTKSDETADFRRYEGNIFTLLRHAEGFLSDHLRVATRMDGMKRIDMPEVPVYSQREALVNALCHRQYETSGATSVYIFDDRVEIASIGPLHFGLRVSDLLAPHESQPWNPLIASGLYRRGVIDTQGSGTLRMIDQARRAGKWLPEIISTNHSVRVEFTRDGWIPTRYRSIELSEAREQILRLVVASPEPVAPADIIAEVGLHSTTVSDHLRALVDAEMLARTGHGRATRYQAR